MSVNHSRVIGQAIVDGLVGLTTANGTAFQRVSLGRPRIKANPQGPTVAWVRLDGIEQAERTAGGHGGAVNTIDWLYRVEFAIWGQNDEMMESRFHDFLQAVLGWFQTHISLGLTPPATPTFDTTWVQRNEVRGAERRDMETDGDRPIAWTEGSLTVMVRQRAAYALTY